MHRYTYPFIYSLHPPLPQFPCPTPTPYTAQVTQSPSSSPSPCPNKQSALLDTTHWIERYRPPLPLTPLPFRSPSFALSPLPSLTSLSSSTSLEEERKFHACRCSTRFAAPSCLLHSLSLLERATLYTLYLTHLSFGPRVIVDRRARPPFAADAACADLAPTPWNLPHDICKLPAMAATHLDPSPTSTESGESPRVPARPSPAA